MQKLPLRILIIEDNPDDYDFLAYEVGRLESAVSCQRVETEAAYVEQLDSPPDLILSDFTLPGFNAVRALDLLHERQLDVPLIVVTGTVTEEIAVACIRHGAADYLLKDRLGRLRPAMERAIAEREARADRRRAEMALRDSEQRFRSLVQNSSDTITIVSVDGTIQYQSPSIVNLNGGASERVLGTRVLDYIHPDDGPMVQAALASLAKDRNATRTVEYRLRRVDGSWVTVESIGQNLLEDPSVRGIVVNTRDVTERKKIEQKLQQSEQYFRLLIERTSDVIILLEPDGRIRYVSPASQAVLGYPPEDLFGTAPLDLIHPDDVPVAAQTLARVASEPGIAHHALVRCRHADGSWRFVEAVGVNLTAEPAVGGIVATLHDVTERQRLEDQLRQSQKMEAIGQLAGGVAHDFNNLLTVISGYGELLLERHHPTAKQREAIEQIMLAGKSAASLTRQLLSFSRREIVVVTDVNLNTIVEQLGRMLHRLIGEDVAIAPELGSMLGIVRADPGQIEQILLNLATNARDAMPLGGTLTVATANVELDQEYVRHHPDARPGPHVMLTVSDTGCGMDASTLAHIFEPFFTTKDVGKGTGLGLSVVYGVVRQSNGSIAVISEPGRGTTFQIYFPRVDVAVAARVTNDMDVRSLRGTETIVVVEDSSQMRQLVRISLESFGYRVLDAAGGEQALQVVEDAKGTIDLLLTDVVMPGMNGREVADKARQTCPGLQVLFMSGYTDDTVLRHGVREEGVSFLQKPFTPAKLAQKVRDVLDGVG